MPVSTIPGVSSGIDWSLVVDQVIAAEKRPATRLQSTIDTNAKRKDALELFRQAMGSLKTAADGLRNGKVLDAFSVTAAGEDAAGRSVLAATVGSGASAGTYRVHVTALATAQRTVAATGWSDAKQLAADGTLTVGTQAIALEAGDTLATVRDKINAQFAKTGVSASILAMKADGSDQRLVLTGQKTGAANAFAVTDGSGGSLVAALGFDGTNVVNAGDATFTFDGSVEIISRPTNVVADAIPGVSLTLNAQGDSTVTVDRQPNAGVNAMQTFVDAYNRVQSLVKSQGAAGGALQNDALLRAVRGSMSSMTLGAAARIDDAGQATAIVDDMTSLGALGVSVQKDGTLAFDKTKFNAVYPARMNDVRAVLSDRMSTFFHYADGITGTYTGQIDQRERQMEIQNATMQGRIDELNNRLEKKRAVLLAQYAKFEASLGSLKSIGESMTAQFSGLNKSNSD